MEISYEPEEYPVYSGNGNGLSGTGEDWDRNLLWKNAEDNDERDNVPQGVGVNGR